MLRCICAAYAEREARGSHIMPCEWRAGTESSGAASQPVVPVSEPVGWHEVVENATGGGPLRDKKGGAHLLPITFLGDPKIEYKPKAQQELNLLSLD